MIVKLIKCGNMNKKIKVDLACGNNKHGDDWIGVDIVETPSVDIVHNLNQYPWPFESNSVDEVHCSHYIEHIPHDVDIYKLILKSESLEHLQQLVREKEKSPSDGLIKFMNELGRILKPSGKATIIAPYYSSIRAYGDPTHTRSICDWTFFYYNKEWRDTNKLNHYGITCDFDTTFDYHISEDMSLRSEQVRNKAFLENWNAVEDIMAKLIKN